MISEPPSTSRLARLVLRAVLPLFAALLLAACGSSSDDDATTTASGASGGSGTFPATVEHRYGTTTVERQPKRIVVVGLTEHDIVLQLGFKPIATTKWYSDQPYGVWPWARDLLGDAKPTVLKTDDGFQWDTILALRPDLIIGTNSGMTRRDYERFSKMAPTLPSVKGGLDYFSRWDQQTELIAAALGKPEEGRRIVADVKQRYADVAEKHPAWKGKTATFTQNAFYEGKIYTYPPGLNTEFLTYLGFRINPALARLADKPGTQVRLSSERLDLLDADVAVFATEKPADVTALRKVPTFRRLPVVADHRSVYTSATLSGAIYAMTPLSLLYVLEHLTPLLEQAEQGRGAERIQGP